MRINRLQIRNAKTICSCPALDVKITFEVKIFNYFWCSMVRFYRLVLFSICLFFTFAVRAQIPIAVGDNPASTLEDTPTTFNVTDNDTEILAEIDPATVDLDLTAGGIQNFFTNSFGEWSVDSDGDVTYTPALNFEGVASTSYTVQNNLVIP